MNYNDNQVVSGWDQIWKAYRAPNFFGRRLHRQRITTLGTVLSGIGLPPSASIVDAGCGSGSTLSIFRSIGYPRAIGIDAAVNSLKISEHLFGFQAGKDVFLRDIRHTGFDDGSFDLVFSQGVLEHYENKSDALEMIRELSRISRKYVLLLQPDQTSLMGRMKEWWQSVSGGSWEKEFPYSKSDYNGLMAKCGYQLIKSGSSNLQEEMWLLYTGQDSAGPV